MKLSMSLCVCVCVNCDRFWRLNKTRISIYRITPVHPFIQISAQLSQTEPSRTDRRMQKYPRTLLMRSRRVNDSWLFVLIGHVVAERGERMWVVSGWADESVCDLWRLICASTEIMMNNYLLEAYYIQLDGTHSAALFRIERVPSFMRRKQKPTNVCRRMIVSIIKVILEVHTQRAQYTTTSHINTHTWFHECHSCRHFSFGGFVGINGMNRHVNQNACADSSVSSSSSFPSRVGVWIEVDPGVWPICQRGGDGGHTHRTAMATAAASTLTAQEINIHVWLAKC